MENGDFASSWRIVPGAKWVFLERHCRHTQGPDLPMFWRGIEKVLVLNVAWTVHGEKSGFIASYQVIFNPQREAMAEM